MIHTLYTPIKKERSALVADGATPAVVQRRLRHSDARITLGIYGHVIGDDQRTTVQNRSARLAPIIRGSSVC
jgi:integrase